MRSHSLALSALFILLTGCSTPEVVKDAATLSAAQMASGQAQMQKFNTFRDSSNEAAARRMREIRTGDASVDASMEVIQASLGLADPTLAGEYRGILGLARMYGDLDARRRSLEDELATEFEAAITPLPNTSGKVDKARAAILALSVDRPDDQQAKAALEFLKMVWEGTKDTREKLKEASKPQ